MREEKAVAADGKLRQQSFHNKQLDKNVKETLYSALETAAAKQLATVGKHLNDLDRSDVKIKTVGQLLIDDQIRLQLFQAVGVENVPLPQLSDELLHGYLSDMAHHPSFTVCTTLRSTVHITSILSFVCSCYRKYTCQRTCLMM